jgi:hypothetical protein
MRSWTTRLLRVRRQRMALAYESALQALIHHSFKLVGAVSIFTPPPSRGDRQSAEAWRTQAITGIK